MNAPRNLWPLLVGVSVLVQTVAAEETRKMLFDFKSPDAAAAWETVNDGVMGGVSDGRVRMTDEGTLEFFGVLSLENNGGFASVRSRPRPLGLAAEDRVAVRLRGDGREYTLNLYVPTSRVAFSYRVPIQTKADEWMEIAIPLKDFQATSFGRPVPSAGPVDAPQVNSLGFLLGDKKPGKFRLEVAWIRTGSADAESQDVTSDQLPALTDGQSWQLVWQDEFDGSELDAAKWEVPDHKRRDGWWSPKAVSLDGDGHLVISTLKDGDRYLDACVRTRGRFEHAQGYYVARIQLQKQPGHWPAFWLYNSSVGKIGDDGRDGTEIDIMEKPWRDERVQHALHWDGYGEEHQSEGKVASVPGVMEGWHTFALWWKADEYIFYVDGQETWRTNAGGVCQVPLYIKLSDEIGTWGGDIAEAQLPDRFLVDYVRVYDLQEAR
jgi:hypothetical protein